MSDDIPTTDFAQERAVSHEYRTSEPVCVRIREGAMYEWAVHEKSFQGFAPIQYPQKCVLVMTTGDAGAELSLILQHPVVEEWTR